MGGGGAWGDGGRLNGGLVDADEGKPEAVTQSGPKDAQCDHKQTC